MNIIKQIKLYREVKDYMAKNPKAVYSSCKLNCEYGAVDASYQLNMNDKHVNVTEYEKHSVHPTTYKVSVIYKNDAEDMRQALPRSIRGQKSKQLISMLDVLQILALPYRQ